MLNWQIIMRGSRNVCPGGGVREWSSSALTAVFFSPQLISMLYKGFRWGPTFPGERGVQMLLFIETTYIT